MTKFEVGDIVTCCFQSDKHTYKITKLFRSHCELMKLTSHEGRLSKMYRVTISYRDLTKIRGNTIRDVL